MHKSYVEQCLIVMLPVDIKTTSKEEALVLETLVRVIGIQNRTKKKCSKSMFAKTAPSLESLFCSLRPVLSIMLLQPS